MRENKLYLFAGSLFFFLLMILSIVFYKERILHSDNVFYAFKLYQTHGFDIEERRLADVLTQVFPLLAIKIGLPANLVFISYSLSFVLIGYFAYLILTLKLKDHRSGFILLLSSVLTVRNIFYLPVAELYQGFCIVIILWSYLNKIKMPKQFNIKWLIVPSGLIICSILFHPLLLLVCVFILILYSLTEKIYLNNNLIFLFSIFIITAVFELLLIKTSGYETDHIVSLSDIALRARSVLSFPITHYSFLFFKKLWPFLLLAFISIVHLIYKRRFLVISFVFSFTIFYLFLIFVSNPRNDSPFVFENYLSAISIFFLLPVYDIKMKRPVLFTGYVILFIASLYYIYCSHYTLTKRIEYVNRLTDAGISFPQKKYMISTVNYPWRYVWTNWTLPFESIFCQYLKDPDKLVTFFSTVDMNRNDSLLKDSTIFLGPEWDVYMFDWPKNKLDKKYFRFPNSSYLKLNTSQDSVEFNDTIFDKNNISIQTEKENYKFDTDSFQVIPIKITNRSGHLIPSLQGKNIRIAASYHIYDSGGNLVNWDGARTLFDIDIDNEFTQGLYVTNPSKKGMYKIEIDLVTENKRWWGINKVVNVKY